MQTNIELRKQVAELEEAGINLATQLQDLQKDYAILFAAAQKVIEAN